MTYIVLALAAVALAFLLFHPRFKGFRTLILGYLTAIGGAVLPLVSQITEYLQTLDWRQYLLAEDDKRNMTVLGVVAGLGVLIIVLRYLTTGPAGTDR